MNAHPDLYARHRDCPLASMNFDHSGAHCTSCGVRYMRQTDDKGRTWYHLVAPSRLAHTARWCD